MIIKFPFSPGFTVAALPADTEPLARTGGIQAMTIYGDSLTDIGIYEGDRVVVERISGIITPEFICVVRVPSGELVAKRIDLLPGGRAVLRSLNRGIPDLHLDPNHLEIEGRITDLVRPIDRVLSLAKEKALASCNPRKPCYQFPINAQENANV